MIKITLHTPQTDVSAVRSVARLAFPKVPITDDAWRISEDCRAYVRANFPCPQAIVMEAFANILVAQRDG